MNCVSTVQGLKAYLVELKDRSSPVIDRINNYNLLISALDELDVMVDMESLKSSIITQLKFLLISKTQGTGDSNALDDHMLHTVIYGPPGVGKTRVCKILAKIWMSLGVLKRKSRIVKPVMPINTEVITLSAGNKQKADIIKRLQQRINTMKKSLNELHPLLNDTKVSMRKIKRIVDVYNRKNGARQRDDLYNPGMGSYDETREYSAYLYRKSLSIPGMDETSLSSIELLESKIKEIEESKILEEFIQFSESSEEIDTQVVDIDNIDTPETGEEEVSDADLVRVISREDMVAGFLGQTALKTEKILEDSLGKVVFIDEAYAIVNDEKDAYGKEALTVLNRFMSEHSGEIIIILAGYKDSMEQSVFKYQPGLKRRCTWAFEIDGYSSSSLAIIFKVQLAETGWSVSQDINLNKFFDENYKWFSEFGGDTHKLAFYCKICHNEYVFNSIDMLERSSHDKIINSEVLELALHHLTSNKISDNTMTINPKYGHMYL